MASSSSINEIEELEQQLSESTLEDVISRHRRERKELQAKLQELKKTAKSDKKKRKECLEEIAQLEAGLEKRHNEELQAAKLTAAITTATTTPTVDPPTTITNGKQQSDNEDNNDDNDDDNNDGPTTAVQGQRISKAQKRRAKKEREARERDEQIRVELQNAEKQPSPKQIELQQITVKLSQRQLTLHHIPSDGDCLYNAVRHQLEVQSLPSLTVAQLRKQTANYVRENKDTLICYMTNPITGEPLSDIEFDDYCNAISDTHDWGGHIELKALSSILRLPIEVIHGDCNSTLIGIDEFTEDNPKLRLIIAYHRHIYQLGEHYNSTIPQQLK